MIIIRIPDAPFQRAQVYARQEGLVNRHIMTEAFQQFLEHYKLLTESKLRFRPLSEPSTGITYRGAVALSLRDQLVRIAQQEGYPVLDVYYTALVKFMAGKGYEDQVPLALFASHDLRDFFGADVFDTPEGRTALVEESLRRFYAHYNGLKARQRQELVIERVPVEHELSYEVLCEAELAERFEELVPRLGSEEYTLIYHAVCQHARAGLGAASRGGSPAAQGRGQRAALLGTGAGALLRAGRGARGGDV